MLSWVGRLRARARRGERGAAAVEAALVTPLICTLVFGIIEFSFALRDYVAVTSSTRAGARIASANAGAGPSVCDSDETASSSCNNASAPEFAKLAANAIQNQGSALNKDQITLLFVYKANSKGYPGADTNTTMPTTAAGCASLAGCVAYTWVKATNKFTYSSGTWTSSTVNACATTSDSVGIYLAADHKFFTGLFGSSVSLADRTVMKFEPLSTDTCSPGKHS